MHSLTFLLMAVLAAAIVRATSTFELPGGPGPTGNYRDNPVYEVGERVEIQWTSDLDYMNLYMWQDYPNPGGGEAYYQVLASNTRSTSLIWTASFDGVSTDFPKDQAGVFYLAVYSNDSSTWDATCHYFNITRAATATTTSAAATATTNKASSAPNTPKDTTATTATATNSSESTSNSGISKGAVAGIAVGGCLGGVAILAGLGFFAWKLLRKRRVSQEYVPTQQVPPIDYYKAEMEDQHRAEMPADVQPPQELYAPEAERPHGRLS